MLDQTGFSGDVGWAVSDVKTGLPLEAVGGDRRLPPASVAKALTTLYALETLGPDHRFTTRILGAGTLSNGRLDGDLILSGGGDPFLDTDALADLASKLKAAGVHEVRGDFYVDDSCLPYTHSIDEEQPEQVGYSPAVSGIALNFNRVHFEWKQASGGYQVAMDARTEKYRPEVAMAEMKVVSRAAPVYTFQDGNGRDQWTVSAQALGTGGSRWLPVRRPADYAGDVFRTLARANGIVLKPARNGTGPAGQRLVLASHSSPTLTVILKDMLKYSNNLTAEMVGMSATAAREGTPPRSLKDSGLSMSQWAAQRFGMKSTRMVDHSGLGADSRMTAEDLVAALVDARRSGVLRPLLKAVPVLDSKGRLVKNSKVRIDAKTGTLNFVSGLGGFITTDDGTELAFAIFAADPETRSHIPREQRERPPGARHWNGQAKVFQQKLIARWSSIYGT